MPSGGGLYPLELYLLARRAEGVEPGVYHYAAVAHGLEQLREVLVPRPLSDYLFMGQHYATDAAAVVVIAAEVEHTLVKYGDRGYRYVLFEAGGFPHGSPGGRVALSEQRVRACRRIGVVVVSIGAPPIRTDGERNGPALACRRR